MRKQIWWLTPRHHRDEGIVSCLLSKHEGFPVWTYLWCCTQAQGCCCCGCLGCLRYEPLHRREDWSRPECSADPAGGSWPRGNYGTPAGTFGHRWSWYLQCEEVAEVRRGEGWPSAGLTVHFSLTPLYKSARAAMINWLITLKDNYSTSILTIISDLYLADFWFKLLTCQYLMFFLAPYINKCRFLGFSSIG